MALCKAMVQQENSTNKYLTFVFVCFPEKSLEWCCVVKIGEVNCHFKVLSFSPEEVGGREGEKEVCVVEARPRPEI